ncbi:NADPH-dependent diflavin oxidoreductase 1 [Penicillium subrubescens]|uniref:NADPH-dependent diflavin oxidoreductase 1 n=1 Tax=Penicillium subrubescens TaxID=1316194 RepID=UPI002544DC85|nr:NADPH-dependent diflavin oxidoreductase 1 [Penicillium subrubescens]KAJ5906943.1 NADPH-dependent diflavin oxidoreductase 1 [Penicillium subrubescens]
MSMSTQGPGHERSALILYGTETGNAQEVAEELGALTERLRFATHVSELNQSKPEALLSYTLIIFVVSTTGQGDLPANARTFWKSLLLKKLPPTYLNGVNFATFGLGDSSYPKYVSVRMNAPVSAEGDADNNQVQLGSSEALQAIATTRSQ